MANEPATKRTLTADQKKQYALGGLIALLAIVVVWNFFGSSRKPTTLPPPTTNDGRIRNADLRAGKAPSAGADNPAAAAVVEEETFGPLEPLPVLGVFSGDVRASRNVFDFPPPPKPPPVPQPPRETQPPPTINIGSLSPGSAIAGSSRSVVVTVTGNYFPPDAVVEVDGRRVPTQRQSGSVLRATLTAQDIASARALLFQVRSASQPDRLWSGKLPFTLQPSPDPSESFTYSGRIGNQAVIGFKDGKRPKVVSVGDSINGAVLWKVVAINERQVEMLDTRNEIRKVIPLTPKSTS